MTQLQDEVLKLLEESKNTNIKELEEASFGDIKNAAGNINPESLKTKVQQPAAKFADHCENVAKAIDQALKSLKTANQVYEFNKNSNPKEQGGVFQKIKNKIGDMRDRSNNKENVLNSLKNASRMMTQAQDDLTQAKHIYSQLNKELKNLYRAVETVQKMVDSKTSFFGRNFGFWK